MRPSTDVVLKDSNVLLPDQACVGTIGWLDRGDSLRLSVSPGGGDLMRVGPAPEGANPAHGSPNVGFAVFRTTADVFVRQRGHSDTAQTEHVFRKRTV